MKSYFNEEAQEILIKAKLEMLELKHPYVGTEHLVLALLHEENEISNILKKYDLTYTKFKKELLKIIGVGSKKSQFFLYTPLLKKVFETALMDSNENNNGEITPFHLFSSLLDVGEGIAIRILLKMNIDLDEIYDIFTSKIYNKENNKNNLLIDTLGINLNKKAESKELDPVIGRDKEISIIEEILCRRTKNNPLLIGEPGTGKTAIVEELARKITEGKISDKLKNYRIISLDMASTVAGTKYRGEFEERIKKILNEIEKDNKIILFIDEIHTLVGAGGAEGAIDASNIFKPALARGKIRCIGATTCEEYKKSIEKDKALDRRFQIINIEEPSKEETKNILLNIKPLYEKYHNVILKDKIIDSLIELTDKYFYERYRPDKQIDILDEVCSKVSISNNNNIQEIDNNINKIKEKKKLYLKENNIKKAYEYTVKEKKLYDKKENTKRKEVTIKDIAEVINNKTKIPLYDILNNNKEIFKNIEINLKEKIFGQEKSINELLKITKKIKLGYKDNKCTSILLNGTTGCGKTTLANTYGELLNNKKPIYINMSEYSDSYSINKFIGAGPGYIGYDDNKYVLNVIKDNPISTIILDNIEKTHPKMLNLIQQIIESSIIKDAKNNIINFKNNTIIIIQNNNQEEKNIGFSKKNNIKSKNILNKIDYIINLEKLDKESIINIINKELDTIKKKYNNIKIDIDNNVINEIIDESEYKIYGANNIEKIIKSKIENIIIDELINKKEIINIDSILSK